MSGGLLPRGHQFRSLPQAVIYDDGTSFSPGATIAVYPGPAVVPVTQGQLTEGEMEAVLVAAAGAGLTDGEDGSFGKPPIADAPTTTVVVVVDGEKNMTKVYGLNEAGAEVPGVGPDQRAAREKVRSFVELISRLVTGAEKRHYVPQRYRILPLAPQPAADAGIEPEVREWPLDGVELTVGQCTAVTGAQAAELRAALESANEITRWQTDSKDAFILAVRPLLPHESECPQSETEGPSDVATTRSLRRAHHSPMTKMSTVPAR